jgi:polar amino acid transport system substrate-binding protein
MRRLPARLWFALLSIGCLVATGCGSPGTPPDLVPITSVPRPQPQGAGESAENATGQGPSADCGDPTASLRPNGLGVPGNSTMGEIARRGRLIAGVDQNTYLFGFRNPSTGALEGFDIDMVREVAEAILGDPNKVQYKVITSAEREKVLQNGDVDIVVRTYTINCDRLREVNFSAAYYLAQQRLVVEKNSSVTTVDELGGKRVCAAAGSTSLRRIAEHDANPVPMSVENWSDCLVMLQQGQVAAVSTDDTILAGMLAQDPNLKMVGPKLAEEPYGIGIPQGKDDLVRFVNAVLSKAMSDGSWQASYGRWLGRTGQPAAAPPQPKYRD